jgi:hypothetical protein
VSLIQPNEYVAGDVIVLSVTFISGGVLVDPEGTIGIQYQVGDGEPVNLEYPTNVTKNEVGSYSAAVDSTGLVGTWTYQGYATPGENQGVSSPATLVVVAPAIPIP